MKVLTIALLLGTSVLSARSGPQTPAHTRMNWDQNAPNGWDDWDDDSNDTSGGSGDQGPFSNSDFILKGLTHWIGI